MGSSFINEHSAEFVLVPQFAKILQQEFGKIIPIFFWSSREGGNMAFESLKGKFVRIVALYPRRPKIENVNQPFIELKLNHLLFKNTNFLNAYGIPVFAGVPLANSLDAFYFDVNCAWFKLRQNGEEEMLHLSLQNKLLTASKNAMKVNAAAIRSIVRTESKVIEWEKAVEYLRKAKNCGDEYRTSFFGANYKPVYFILNS